MGNTCNSMADSCQCMTKPMEMLSSNYPPNNLKKKKKREREGEMFVRTIQGAIQRFEITMKKHTKRSRNNVKEVSEILKTYITYFMAFTINSRPRVILNIQHLM